MGFDAQQTGAMTPWHLLACYEGFAVATGRKAASGKSKPMSASKLKDLGVEGF